MNDFLSRLAQRAAGREPTGSTLEPRTRPMYAAEATPADLQPFVPPPAEPSLDGDDAPSSMQPPRLGSRLSGDASRSENPSEQDARQPTRKRAAPPDKTPPTSQPPTHDLPASEPSTNVPPAIEPPALRAPRSVDLPTHPPATNDEANASDVSNARPTLEPRVNPGDARREHARRRRESATREARSKASPDSGPDVHPKTDSETATAGPTRPSLSHDATRERQSRPILRPRQGEPSPNASSPNAPDDTPAESSKPAEVTIEIGRLEVRATSTKKTQTPAPSRQKFRPKTSLDDYLARRRGDDR
ncbi:MAG: hypothetical protein ACOC9W_01650 [Persicimonas sp.]